MAIQMNIFGEEVEMDKEKIKTVISASRRTDIPAFYYDWLQKVLKSRKAELPNPMFPNKSYVVDLEPSKVHTIVLWSKNFRNVLENPMHLDEYNIYFQYTINNYSRLLEPNVPEYKETMRILEGLLKKYKPEQFNIRFDPIVISLKGEITPSPDMPQRARLAAFEQLCSDIRTLGMENCRVSTSYIALYGHVKNRIKSSGLDLIELNDAEQVNFFADMADTAQKYGISLYSCASPVLEQVKGINKGHCIDGDFLEKLFGGKVRKSKDSGQRKACGCTYSKDIGMYSKSTKGMKCLHGCIYCYA